MNFEATIWGIYALSCPHMSQLNSKKNKVTRRKIADDDSINNIMVINK